MKLYIHAQDFTVSDTFKAKIEEKLKFINKYMIIDEDASVNIVIKEIKELKRIEITMTTRVGYLRSEVTSDNINTSLELAIDKLEDQIRNQKTRLSKRHKESLAEAFIEDDDKILPEDVLVKTKVITAEMMDIDEAILQMEMLGHTFFVYTDKETEEIAIVYKRLDGDYGCIEVEKPL
ncbi:MAG: ribosome-associated translation inhibitor RaiA [Erysipelotrichaceae bacterium]